MRRLPRARALAPAAVVAALAAAGCGGTSSDDNAGTTSESGGATVAAAPSGGATSPTVPDPPSGPRGSYGAADGTETGAVAGIAASSDDSSQGVEGVYGSGGTDADGPMEAPTRATSAAVVRTGGSGLGTILVDGDGHTLYRFTADEGATSACHDTCAGKWPPLTTSGDPRTGGQARTALVGTSERGDGIVAVTYDGHPLYRYGGDATAGDTTGEALQAFGGRWYAVAPNGTLIEPGG